MSKIKTAGDLREFLCNTINGVANGTFDLQKAKEITKLAGQINESIYSEIRAAMTQHAMGKEASRFGELTLGLNGQDATSEN